MSNITELKEKLAVLRDNSQKWALAYKTEQEWLEARMNDLTGLWNSKNSELIKSYNEANAETAAVESELRAALIAHYEATGEKIFDKELSVRVTSTIKYAEDRALDWASANAPFLILHSIKKKQFEEIAKTEKFDFVEIEEKSFGGNFQVFLIENFTARKDEYFRMSFYLGGRRGAKSKATARFLSKKT